MLIFGDYTSLPDISIWKGDLFIYNLTSYKEGFEPINILFPANQLNYADEFALDMAYADYLINCEPVFYEFFYKIIFNLYNGRDVFVLVTRDYFNDLISESILKFIQCRYGYNGALINEVDDIEYLNKEETFSHEGIITLDADKERFSRAYMMRNGNCFNNNGVQVRPTYEGLMTMNDIQKIKECDESSFDESLGGRYE